MIVKSPGKLFAFVGPFLLFNSSSSFTFVQFEASFAAASLTSIFISMGSQNLISYAHFNQGVGAPHEIIISRMVFVFIIVLLSLVPFSFFKKTSAAICLAFYGPLLLSLFCQSIGAAALRAIGYYSFSAFSDHITWIAVSSIALLFKMLDKSFNEEALIVTLIYSSIISILVAGFSLRKIGPQFKVRTKMTIWISIQLGGPSMIIELCCAIMVSTPKLVTYVLGNPGFATEVALASRLVAPITFIGQACYSAYNAKLFDANQREASKYLYSATAFVTCAALAAESLLLALQKWTTIWHGNQFVYFTAIILINMATLAAIARFISATEFAANRFSASIKFALALLGSTILSSIVVHRWMEPNSATTAYFIIGAIFIFSTAGVIALLLTSRHIASTVLVGLHSLLSALYAYAVVRVLS